MAARLDNTVRNGSDPAVEESVAKSRPPLIAHVVFNLDVGGLENGVINLVNRIPAERYRQAIVCLKSYTSFRDRLERDDVPVFALNKRAGKDLGNYIRLWRLFRELRPDIVHTRNFGTIDTVFPAKLAGVARLVHGEHGWDVADETGTRRKYRMIRRSCMPLIDAQIAVSGHIAAWLRDTVGVPAGDIRHIYNGVDTGKFHPADGGRASAAIPEGLAPEGTFVIGSVGRMADIKDPMTLVRAFQRLLADDDAESRRLRLVMIGDGPLYESARHALAQNGGSEVSWLPGRRDDIDEILRGLDLFVLPSRNEGISNTILEAMATGLPVVATDVGGNPELVLSGRTGRLVPPQDPASMADAIFAYARDVEKARAHGAEGRRRAARDFSIESMTRRYLETYDAVVRANVSHRP